MIKNFKRLYHPGFGNYHSKKLCLPICPSNVLSSYYKPVWGNKIQEIQLNNDTYSYETNKINYFSRKIDNIYKNEVIYLPTSHNTPIEIAIKSCRNLSNPYKIINEINKLNTTDENGVFINNELNQQKLMDLLKSIKSSRDKIILKSAFYGIFSNYGDSIYIANDYLQVSDKHVVVSNYPDNVSQREIERCRVVAYCLKLGNYPIILDDNIDFEGEANIKYIPAIVDNNGIKNQMCITYTSSRSKTDCIDNINKYMNKLELPILKGINIKPKKDFEQYFYHLDCILNFSVSNKIQYFSSEIDFFNNYKKNGILIYEENGLDENYENLLLKLFEKIIPVKKEDDLLCSNMIVSQNCIIGSSLIKNKKSIPNYFHFNHPSTGGGGAHKCCSNIINHNDKLTIEDWIDFNKKLDINIKSSFIEGVNSEIERLKYY